MAGIGAAHVIAEIAVTTNRVIPEHVLAVVADLVHGGFQVRIGLIPQQAGAVALLAIGLAPLIQAFGLEDVLLHGHEGPLGQLRRNGLQGGQFSLEIGDKGIAQGDSCRVSFGKMK